MYRAMEPPERARGIAQIAFQLDALEGLCVGPYLAGGEVTSADSAVFPTVVFMQQVRGLGGAAACVGGKGVAVVGFGWVFCECGGEIAKSCVDKRAGCLTG